MQLLDERPHLIKSQEALEELRFQEEIKSKAYRTAYSETKLVFKGFQSIENQILPSQHSFMIRIGEIKNHIDVPTPDDLFFDSDDIESEESESSESNDEE